MVLKWHQTTKAARVRHYWALLYLLFPHNRHLVLRFSLEHLPFRLSRIMSDSEESIVDCFDGFCFFNDLFVLGFPSLAQVFVVSVDHLSFVSKGFQ